MRARELMQMAIDKAREGIRAGQTPFGACIARDGQVVACAHNRVWASTDITAHAEVTAIREACERLGSISLAGCVIYSTCEPCPMCFSACHWAGLARIVYGASIEDARAAGFNELGISNERMRALGGSPVVAEGGFMREACAGLFREWTARTDRRTY